MGFPRLLTFPLQVIWAEVDLVTFQLLLSNAESFTAGGFSKFGTHEMYVNAKVTQLLKHGSEGKGSAFKKSHWRELNH